MLRNVLDTADIVRDGDISPLVEKGVASWANFRLADHSPRLAESAAEVSLRRELGSCVELEGLFVSLDRVALRFPGRQSTF